MSATGSTSGAPLEVAVIGAGLAGVTTALLLRRLRPKVQVVVIEEAELWPSAGHSEPLEGRRLEEVRLTLALRRALLVGEHEYTWRTDGLVRTAELPCGGLLRATLAEEGRRPRRLEVLDAEGLPWEVLEDVTWSDDGRSARSWTLLAGRGTTIWTESLEQLDRTRRYRSSFFVPPDRRERRATASATVVETLRLPRASPRGAG